MANVIKITVDLPTNAAGSGVTVVNTDWVINSYPDYSNPSNTVFSSLNDTANISVFRYTVTDPTKPYYARYRFHNSDGSVTEWSKILILRADQTHITQDTGSLVQTPGISTASTATNLTITTTPINMYYGSDTHATTSWYVKRPDDSIVYSSVNSSNLTSITIPLNTLNKDDVYLLQAIHNTNSGISSLPGEILYQNNISLVDTFDVESVPVVYANYSNYIKLLKKPVDYVSTDIIVIDEAGNTVTSNLGQTTITPNYNTTSLNLYTIYTVKVRIKLTTGTYSSYKTIYTGRLSNLVNRSIDQYVTYLDKFNNTDTLDLSGQTIQSTVEHVNGDILLTKQYDNKIYRYKHYRGKLSYIDTILTINNINPKKLKQYVNLVRLPNNDLLVDYEAIREIHDGSPLYTVSMDTDPNIIVVKDGANITRYRPVFEHYTYDYVNDTFSFNGRVSRDDEMYGTADTNALVVIGSIAYYIPAKKITSLTVETFAELNIRVLDLTTMVITDLTNLPIAGIFSYANLDYSKPDTLIFSNGSGLEYNVNNVNLNTVVNQYDRVNNDIYEYKISTGTFTIVSSTPVTVNINNYLYQTYLRKDGKIIMFNSVYSGPETGIQNTILYNPADLTCVEIANDTPDNLIFRNTIVLQNGDFLRVSNLAKGLQVVDTYVSDTYKTNQIVTNVTKSLITDLVINPGEKVAIDYPYRYSTITINGTGPNNTGKLNWIDGNTVRAYYWNDLLLPGNRTILGTTTWNSITFLPGATLTIV